ncbi:MAG TPA: NFACT RNA binding domain-containing protein [Candidatus Baltobacteraceae bacterium]|nr:NFACT RNA binding domain-containing protein [Candidatus Baltobacteraceae bacterium]
MRTDPSLIARLAAEIESRFRGARVTDVGLLSDGRTAIALHARRETHLLCLDVFGTPPLVTVEDGELPIAAEPGFIRAAGAALRGASLLSAKARKGDRLLRLTFGTRSRFGVGDEIDLYVELVPRFGNLILVKRDTVVAAAKEFSIAENPARAVSAGATYALPPMLAREVPPALEGPASVLDAMRAHRDRASGNDARARTTQRRSSLLKRLDARERKVRDELAKVAAKHERALARDELRVEGEMIFAGLFDIAEAQRDDAKERAAKLFAQYKKFGASVPHLEERQAALRLTLTAIDELRWEAERAGDAEFEDVERAAESLDRRSTKAPSSERTKRRKRSPLEVRTDSGSRILIGRSPAENADLTFHVARPNDLWFHAQGMPGAHVILQRDDRLATPPEDIEKAASLAAFYSKGQTSAKVAIDYTERKFVRAQRDAMPGLVWYTNPRTIVVEPRS